MGLTMDDIRECLQRAWCPEDTSSRPRMTGHYGRKCPGKKTMTKEKKFHVRLVPIFKSSVIDLVDSGVYHNDDTSLETYTPWNTVTVDGVTLLIGINHDKGIVYIADKATVMDKKMFPKRVIV